MDDSNTLPPPPVKRGDIDPEKFYRVILNKPVTYLGTGMARARLITLKGAVVLDDEVFSAVVSAEETHQDG